MAARKRVLLALRRIKPVLTRIECSRGSDPWITIGRGYARMHNAYDPAGLTMDIGIEVALAIEDSQGDPSGEVYVPEDQYVYLPSIPSVRTNHFTQRTPHVPVLAGAREALQQQVPGGAVRCCDRRGQDPLGVSSITVACCYSLCHLD